MNRTSWNDVDVRIWNDVILKYCSLQILNWNSTTCFFFAYSNPETNVSGLNFTVTDFRQRLENWNILLRAVQEYYQVSGPEVLQVSRPGVPPGEWSRSTTRWVVWKYYQVSGPEVLPGEWSRSTTGESSRSITRWVVQKYYQVGGPEVLPGESSKSTTSWVVSHRVLPCEWYRSSTRWVI